MWLCRLLLCLLAGLAGAIQGQDQNASYVYNNFMASLSTSRQPFSGTYGHWHELAADDLPSLRATGARLMLVTMEPCSAFAPHYQVGCGETIYVKSGQIDVVLLVDGMRLQHTLGAGDVVTIPAGAMHSIVNSHCRESESLVLLTAADPFRIFPADQALSMPQQALVSGFGLDNYTQFADPVRLPKAHLYSLNSPECTARCAAIANQTGSEAGAGSPNPAPALVEDRSFRRLAGAPAVPAQAAPARRLAQERRRDSDGGGSGTVRHSGGAAEPGAALRRGARGGRRLLEDVVYNDYMASLPGVYADVDTAFATRRELDYEWMSGLEATDMQATLAEFKACSMSAMHFQPDADEFTTVLSGTIDMILLVNGTRKVVRTLQPGDVAVIPRGVVHYFANANCDPNTMLVLFNAKAPTRVYPLDGLMELSPQVLTAAFGLEGGPDAYPSWNDAINVPEDKMGSLNDPQCTTRCDEAAALTVEEEQAAEQGAAAEADGRR